MNNREGWGVRWYVWSMYNFWVVACVAFEQPRDNICFKNSYPSGNLYSGEWKNNTRHGEGAMRWRRMGQQYVGKWQDGVQVDTPFSPPTILLTSTYISNKFLNSHKPDLCCFGSHELFLLTAWSRHARLDPDANGWIAVFPEQSVQRGLLSGSKARRGNLSLRRWFGLQRRVEEQ